MGDDKKNWYKKPEAIVFGAVIIAVVSLSFVNLAPENLQKGTSTRASDLPVIGAAPELAGISNWINSEPLTLEKLKGKVVLIDFWTYSCINCIRTLPYLTAWDAKYNDKGFVILGVHTPEFEFEKDPNNVRAAVEKYGIKYPVAQDNGYETWRAYKNSYWPRKYLVDKDGFIRYDHIGEGAYEETERAIQKLLAEINEEEINEATEEDQSVDFSQIGTPELFLGYDFARQTLGNAEGFRPGETVNYAYAEPTEINTVYLSGEWKNENDRIIAVRAAKLFLIYKAKDVNIVAGGPARLNMLLDDWVIFANQTGSDTYIESFIARVNVTDKRLYNIISTPSYEIHKLEVQASPGFELYTFTFG